MYELSPKDLRAITLMEKYKQDAMATRLKNYHHFLDTLVYLNQTLADTGHEIKSWQKFGERKQENTGYGRQNSEVKGCSGFFIISASFCPYKSEATSEMMAINVIRKTTVAKRFKRAVA